MNNLEICKRIAEIRFKDTGNAVRCHHGKVFIENFHAQPVEFNPLTDDPLCLTIIENHGKYIGKKHVIDGSIVVFTLTPEEFEDNPDKFDNREILLSIIEVYAA